MTVLYMNRGQVYSGVFESEFGKSKILITTNNHETYTVMGMMGNKAVVAQYDIVDVLDEVKVDELETQEISE